MPLPVAIELAMVARFYERFGDHAVNLARRMAALVGGGTEPGPRAPTEPSTRGSAPREQCFGDLHRIEGSALSQIVAHDKERERAGDARRPADAADGGHVASVTPSGVGRSSSRTPGAAASSSLACSGARSRSNSARMAAEWPVKTGTRTQVVVTTSSDRPRILRLSFLYFCSSLVSALPSSTTEPAPGARCGRWGVEDARGGNSTAEPSNASSAQRSDVLATCSASSATPARPAPRPPGRWRW